MEKGKKMTADTGTTMVEVLVAFAVLTVIFAICYQVICLSGDLYMKTVDLIKYDQQFEAELYKKNSSWKADSLQVAFSLIPEQEEEIRIQTEFGKADDVSQAGQTGIGSVELGKIQIDCFENSARKEKIYRFGN